VPESKQNHQELRVDHYNTLHVNVDVAQSHGARPGGSHPSAAGAREGKALRDVEELKWGRVFVAPDRMRAESAQKRA
jgi:hypothetical protein